MLCFFLFKLYCWARLATDMGNYRFPDVAVYVAQIGIVKIFRKITNCSYGYTSEIVVVEGAVAGILYTAFTVNKL